MLRWGFGHTGISKNESADVLVKTVSAAKQMDLNHHVIYPKNGPARGLRKRTRRVKEYLFCTDKQTLTSLSKVQLADRGGYNGSCRVRYRTLTAEKTYSRYGVWIYLLESICV